MAEKRKYQRYNCKLKCRFEYFDDNTEIVDTRTVKGKSGKARVLDISRGGIFISTNTSVSINRPIIVSYITNKKSYTLIGNIVRTGLIENNPAEVLNKFKALKIKEKIYIAVEFQKPVDEFTEGEIEQ